MTIIPNNTGADKEISKVKALNETIKSKEFLTLMSNIKDVKHRIDALLNDEKERIRKIDEERHQAALAKKLAEEESKRAEDVYKPVKLKITSEESHDVSAAKTPEIPALPSESAIKKEEEKPTTTAVKPAPSSTPQTLTVTATYKPPATPSYIRGIITPSTQPPRQPGGYNNNRRPPFDRNNTTNTRPGGFQNSAPGSGTFQNRNNNFRGPGGFQNGTPGFQRPAGGAPGTVRPKTPLGKDSALPSLSKERKTFDNKKKDFVKQPDDKKLMNKRTLIRKGFIQDAIDDDERMGTRKLKNKKPRMELKAFAPIRIEKAVITTENLTVKILSEKIGKTAQEIIKQLMVLGIMTSINSVVDFPTMELVANELGIELELKLDKTKEAQLEEFHDEADTEEQLLKRPPIITVMGHVDHGKTSLLDYIRKTSVVTGEAGGITQHIGAYSVIVKNEKITFLDTPGHEAFTEMRKRGAKVTDIAVLIVAADDGIMPQTIEAINHAKAAEVPIIVAINKIDKPAANPERIRQKLTEYGLLCEEYGGETMMIPLSAKSGEGVDKLLESILFLAEYNNYRANPDRKAKASIIEAKLDKGKGPIANLIVENGTLKVGDFVVSGMTCGRIRAMVDDKGRNIKEAGPSTPVSILGFNDVPFAGDSLFVVEDEKMAKQVIGERNTKLRNEQANQGQKVTLDDVFTKISEGQIKDLNIVIKADVQGSVEALKSSLEKLVSDEVKVKVVHGGVGAINKSDLMLAEVSKAILIGFNVRPDTETKALAESTGVDIRLYRIIYEAIEDMEKAMKGMVTPKYRESILGKAEVRNVFKISNVGMVAGCFVIGGKILRNSKARVYRDEKVVFEGNISTLKRFKDDAKEVSKDYECGICIDDYTEIKEGDIIESFVLEEIK